MKMNWSNFTDDTDGYSDKFFCLTDFGFGAILGCGRNVWSARIFGGMITNRNPACKISSRGVRWWFYNEQKILFQNPLPLMGCAG
ncbi:hypothetical protein HPY86_05790 [candidate division WOR-3 bacterium]|nr:hypothetical protein [candidate division WOR-3 bacterium]